MKSTLFIPHKKITPHLEGKFLLWFTKGFSLFFLELFNINRFGGIKVSNNLKDSIRSHMEQKTTEELREIWERNDRDQYTWGAFEAIKEILQERGESIPPQVDQKMNVDYEEKSIVILLRIIAIATIIIGVILFFLGLGIVILVGSIVTAIFQYGFAEIISLLNKIYWKIK